MKHMKTIQIPAKTEKVVEKITCDLCGKEISDTQFKIDDVEICHESGSSYPEGGSGTRIAVDMCGDCFNGKLMPWLKSQGAEPRTEEWDW